VPAQSRSSRERERLRRSYRPVRVRVLFVGESPPASGRFFYQADSGLYRAIREAFVAASPALQKRDFLEAFRDLGCYLVDLCEKPVDRLSKVSRGKACRNGEIPLAKTIRKLRPQILIVVVRSIAPNVKRSEQRANWTGQHIELRYPGRWHHHRAAFVRQLAPLLRKNLEC
jgi:hypothetical protein